MKWPPATHQCAVNLPTTKLAHLACNIYLINHQRMVLYKCPSFCAEHLKHFKREGARWHHQAIKEKKRKKEGWSQIHTQHKKKKKKKKLHCFLLETSNMATGATPDGLFWSVYEGCISCYDNCVERRPYHRNCGCALHNKSLINCTHKLPRCNNVSYPMRRAWSEGSLVLAASSSSPSQVATGGRPQPSLANVEEENKNCFS